MVCFFKRCATRDIRKVFFKRFSSWCVLHVFDMVCFFKFSTRAFCTGVYKRCFTWDVLNEVIYMSCFIWGVLHDVFYMRCFNRCVLNEVLYMTCLSWGVLYEMFYMRCFKNVLYMRWFTWGVLHEVFYMRCFTWGVLLEVFYMMCFTSIIDWNLIRNQFEKWLVVYNFKNSANISSLCEWGVWITDAHTQIVKKNNKKK